MRLRDKRESPAPLTDGDRASDFSDSYIDEPEDRRASRPNQLDWLTGEFIAVTAALTESQAAYLVDELGVRDVPVGVRPGVARVRPHGKYWEWDDTGRPHIILAEWFAGEVCDLIAFRSAQPGKWLCRTGRADILGHYQVQAAIADNTPLVLHRTPLAWLQHGCKGAVVLDWRTAFYSISSLDRILTPDEAYGRVVKREMESRRPREPQIRWAA